MTKKEIRQSASQSKIYTSLEDEQNLFTSTLIIALNEILTFLEYDHYHVFAEVSSKDVTNIPVGLGDL